MTVRSFLDGIRKDPYSLVTNFDIRWALDRLRYYAEHGTQEQSVNARTILKKAGLEAFMPEKSRYRKTDNPFLRCIQTIGMEAFFQLMDNLESQARPIWVRYKNGDERKAVEDIVNTLSNKTQSEEFIRSVYKKSVRIAGIHLTDILLAFISEQWDTSYSALRKFYYNKKKIFSNRAKINQRVLTGQLKTSGTSGNVTRFPMPGGTLVIQGGDIISEAINALQYFYHLYTLRYSLSFPFLSIPDNPE
jgi:hypothetical protein